VLKFIFFVPSSHKEEVKNAIFDIGASKMGNYSHCCFETKGMGQFKPLKGANPSLGNIGQIARVEEYKVEMIIYPEFLSRVIETLKTSHPYETIAYEYYPINS
jgi:hypothetical protein